ncbi:hypothetical protein EHS13_02215 [Paenibacillus psychroresistens]|uniref:Uncharacterized protein n=1 Tax=Paenibacillus psychroresistens TaxID=1778678 RepID=A0A6B8REB4_9BACL|nr:hypothetical protein [Paenibacillus psychroresistens]QGQ93802.1 hypothetical protein EHS13_02215 [Paenibacillus psychroresistens]
MKSFFVILCFVILISACSKEVRAPKDSYEGHGSLWDVHVENSFVEKNGSRFFNIIYSYKGSNDELQEITHISFAQGTQLNSQIVNVFNNSHKDKLIAEGKYQEEEITRLGIIFDDLKHKNDKDFKIEFKSNDNDKDFDVFKVIESDRINLQIHWENNQEKHEESIEIKGK